MRPQLALQQPQCYDKYFEHLVDFEVDVGDPRDLRLPSKPVWLDCSRGWVTTRRTPVAYILPLGKPPKKHLIETARLITPPGILRVGMCQGTYNHMEQLKDYVDIIALPNTVARSIYVTKETAHQFHFYELCNLDELRRYPIRSLNTSMHITAAMVGIDLTRRERRPKKLPTFRQDTKLTEAQLELAIENAKAIREALDSHVLAKGV